MDKDKKDIDFYGRKLFIEVGTFLAHNRIVLLRRAEPWLEN